MEHKFSISQFENETNPLRKLKILNSLIFDARETNVQEAINLSEKIISLSKEYHNQEFLGRGYNHLSVCYWLKGRYNDALGSLEKALDIANDLKDLSLKARIYNNLGSVYREKSEFFSALQHYEESLKINLDKNLSLKIAENYINIASIYYELLDYNLAIQYIHKALDLLQSNKENHFQFNQAFNTLGNIYYKLHKLDEAENAFLELKNNSSKEEITHDLANIGIGKIEMDRDNLDLAKSLLETSLNNLVISGHLEGKIVASFYLAKIYWKLGLEQKTLDTLKDVEALSIKHTRKTDLLSIYEFYTLIFETQKNYKLAFENMKKVEELGEEIFQIKTFNKLSSLEWKNELEIVQKEKDMAEKSAKLKQNFVANMSHEIRTPMNAILGMTELLLKNQPRPDQYKWLNAIAQSADNLLVIINDILDFSKLESGKIQLEYHAFSVVDFFEKIKNIFDFNFQNKNLFLIYNIPENIHKYYYCDTLRLQQIFTNLISNSYKFTENGGVEFGVKLISENEINSELQFYIKDSGIGIKKEYVNKIFESFSQAGTDVARKYGGTGLGLTITKQLVELMKGKIQVESQDQMGTIFKINFTLPKAEKENVVEFENKSFDEISQLQSCNVLVVEDNPFNIMLAEDMLKEIIVNPVLTKAVNGKEAIQFFEPQKFDIVLMDIQMPEIDGLTAIQLIKKNFPEDKTPFVAMTANALREDINSYLQNGFDMYLSKPYNLEKLWKIFRKFFSDRDWLETQNEVSKTENITENSNILPQEEYFNATFLKSFTNNDATKQIKYINLFLEDAPNLVEDIKNSRYDENLVKLRTAAHSLKTQLKYMGVDEKYSHVFLIETMAKENQQNDDLQQEINHLLNVIPKVFLELKKYLLNLQPQ